MHLNMPSRYRLLMTRDPKRENTASEPLGQRLCVTLLICRALIAHQVSWAYRRAPHYPPKSCTLAAFNCEEITEPKIHDCVLNNKAVIDCLLVFGLSDLSGLARSLVNSIVSTVICRPEVVTRTYLSV